MSALTPEAVAAVLTKASRRALVRISHVNWTEEGYPGPARTDVYSLWWGRDGKYRLVVNPQPYEITDTSCRWRWKLTPFGLSVRQVLHKECWDVQPADALLQADPQP